MGIGNVDIFRRSNLLDDGNLVSLFISLCTNMCNRNHNNTILFVATARRCVVLNGSIVGKPFLEKPSVAGTLYTKTGNPQKKFLILASDFFHKHFPLNGYYTTKVLLCLQVTHLCRLSVGDHLLCGGRFCDPLGDTLALAAFDSRTVLTYRRLSQLPHHQPPDHPQT